MTLCEGVPPLPTVSWLSCLQDLSLLCGLDRIVSTGSEAQAAEWHLGGAGSLRATETWRPRLLRTTPLLRPADRHHRRTRPRTARTATAALR